MGPPGASPDRPGDVNRSTQAPLPFFSSEATPAAGDRLLLISPHFPPGQAAGARRWEKLAQFAVDRGFGLDVVTFDPQDLDSPDSSRLEALPNQIRVFGVRSRRHALARAIDALWGLVRPLRSLARPSTTSVTGARVAGSNLTGDDWPRREEVLAAGCGPSTWPASLHAVVEIANEAAWADAAAECAWRHFDPDVHRAVISCGPPHMVHHAARRLSKRAGIPLIVDLRDPWSRRERVMWSIASPLWFRIAAHFEAKAFDHASLIVMNTPAASQLMGRVYPSLAHKIMSVTNGFDVDEPIRPDHGNAFVLAYAGSIYLDRSPRHLFRAVRQVASELELDPADLRVELMGHFETDPIREMAREEGVGDRVVLHPPGNLREVARLLARSAMLVNLPQDSDLAIPSKIFEYMTYPAWLLALAVGESATGQVLAGTRADVVAPDDEAGIARVIRERYRAYRAGDRPRPVADDPRLGRAHQASMLFDALDRCVGRAGRSAR